MANQTYSLAINGTIAAQFFTNVLHYNFDDAGFTTRADAAAALNAAFDAANRTAFRSMCPTAMGLLSYKSRCVSAPGGFESFLPIGAPTGGTRTGNVGASG